MKMNNDLEWLREKAEAEAQHETGIISVGGLVNDVLKICATVSHQDILDFCSYYEMTFYQMGCPENWEDKTVFRASTLQFGFPPRGLTVELLRIANWKKNPPFIAEGI